MLSKKMVENARNVGLEEPRKMDIELVYKDTNVLVASFNFNHHERKGEGKANS